MRSSRTRSRRTFSRTPGSRSIGGNAYRRSLDHVCTIASNLRGAGCVRENQSGKWDVSRDKQIYLYMAELLLYQLHHLGVEPLFPGPQPLSRQDVCSYIVDPRDVSCSKRQQLPLGPQEDLANQFAKWTWPQTPLVIYVGAHGGPWDLLGNSWEQEIQPTSPDSWCAMRDDGPST